jgi:phospho-N-acetylmuramoyl-pentapeptide-transferase
MGEPALALGAALAVAAFRTGQWLLLPLIGIVYVADAVGHPPGRLLR